MRLLILSASLVVLVSAHAQPASGPQFEVAAVRGAAASGGRGRPGSTPYHCTGGPGTSGPGRWTCATSMGDLIFKAYQLQGYQFTPPDWMWTSVFEIDAKIPEGATQEQLPLMIRNLLEDRFKLAVHFVKKDEQVYQMTVGKEGLKFKEWADLKPWDEGEKRPSQLKAANLRPTADGPASWQTVDGAHAFRGKLTMEALAGYLSKLGRPVIDATGLKGEYDIMLDYVMDTQPLPGREPPPPAVGPTLLKAVESQLGLKLELNRGAIDVLVIDHVEKAPTEN